MDSSEENFDDEDFQAKYYANLHFVDTVTVDPVNSKSAMPRINLSKKMKKALSNRYWSKNIGSTKKIDHESFISTIDLNNKNTKKDLTESKIQTDDGAKYNINENSFPNEERIMNYIKKCPTNMIFPNNKKKKNKKKQKKTSVMRRIFQKSQLNKNNNDKISDSYINFVPLVDDVLYTSFENDSINKKVSLDNSPNKYLINPLKFMDTNNVQVPNPFHTKCTGEKTSNGILEITPNLNKQSIDTNIDCKNVNEVNIIKEAKLNPSVSVSCKDFVNIDSSDDESVLVVELPKHLDMPISIESSDDELESTLVTNKKDIQNLTSNISKNNNVKEINKNSNDRRCVSPVSSIISSISDDFIQSDYNKLNNVKHHSTHMEADFNSQGLTVLDRISKDNCVTSIGKSGKTAITNSLNVSNMVKSLNSKEVFATPKCESVQKLKKYTLSNKKCSTPFIDIYDSESSDIPESVCEARDEMVPSKRFKPNKEKSTELTISTSDEDSVVINITHSANDNMTVSNDIQNHNDCKVIPEFVNKFIGNNDKKITTEECIQDMKKFYDQSWGGENFDHMKLKLEMPRSKGLWTIDLSDKLSDNKSKHKIKCLRCNKTNHREQNCPFKLKICYMCGKEGHLEYKCPQKMCLNCGTKGTMFRNKCQNCELWRNIRCNICQIYGHPAKYCPDIWRRYHLTVKNEVPLFKGNEKKSETEIYCSGCARKGHLVNNCKMFVKKVCKYVLPTPYICQYSPIYTPDGLRMISNALKTDDNAPQQNKITVKSVSVINSLNIENSKFVELKKFKTPISSKKVKLSTVVNDSNDTLDTSCEIMTSNDDSCIIIEDNNDDHKENNFPSPKIHLTREISKSIRSYEGKAYLNKLCNKYKNSYQISNLEGESEAIFINGDSKTVSVFRSELEKWLDVEKHLPNCREVLIQKINSNLQLLKDDHGDPNEIYEDIKNIEKAHDKKNNQKFPILLKSRLYKKLNMILIGQYGLDNGQEHVQKLIDSVLSLKSLNNTKYISTEFRMDINESFKKIFSEYKSNDYANLMSKWQNRKKIEFSNREYKNFYDALIVHKTSVSKIVKKKRQLHTFAKKFRFLKNKEILGRNVNIQWWNKY